MRNATKDKLLASLSLSSSCHFTCHPSFFFSDSADLLRPDMELRKFRRQAYAVSTKATYRSQLRAYLTFCIHDGYQPPPDSATALSRYAAFLARFLSVASIAAYLNTVRLLHLEHGLENPTKNNFGKFDSILQVGASKTGLDPSRFSGHSLRA